MDLDNTRTTREDCKRQVEAIDDSRLSDNRGCILKQVSMENSPVFVKITRKACQVPKTVFAFQSSEKRERSRPGTRGTMIRDSPRTPATVDN